MKRYYSVKEASKALGFSTNTIYKYLDEGKIQAKRIGRGRFKIPYSELEQFLTPEQKLPQIEAREEVAEKIADTYYEKEQTKFIEPALGDAYFMTLFIGLVMSGFGLVRLLLDFPSSLPSLTTTVTLTLIGVLMVLRSALYKTFLPVRQYIKILAILALLATVFELGFTKNYNEFAVLASLLPVILIRLVRAQLGKNALNFFQEFALFSILVIFILGALILTTPEAYEQILANFSLQISQSGLGTWWFLVLTPPAIFLLTPIALNNKNIRFLFVIGAVLSFLSGMVLTLNGAWQNAYLAYMYAYFAFFVLWWSIQGTVIVRKKLVDIAGIFTWMAVSTVLGLWAINSMNHYQTNQELLLQRQKLAQVIEKSNTYVSTVLGGMLSSSQKSNLSDMLTGVADTDEFNKVAEQINNNVPHALRVVILDQEGKAVAFYPRSDNVLGLNFSHRDYFVRTKVTKKSYVSTTFESQLGNEVIVITLPIFKNNQFVGLIAFSPNLNSLSREYQSLMYGSELYVFDSKHNFVLHADPEKIGKSADKHLIDESAKLESIMKDHVMVSDVAITSNYTFTLQKDISDVVNRSKSVIVTIAVLLLVNSLISMSASIALARKKDNDE